MTPGWITHAGGVGRLIQLRGPRDHQKYPEKTIFLESRMLIVCPTESLYPLVPINNLTALPPDRREYIFLSKDLS